MFRGLFHLLCHVTKCLGIMLFNMLTDQLPDQPRSALMSEPKLQRSLLKRSSYRYWM